MVGSHWMLAILLAAVSLPCGAAGQDFYQNFLGHWQGTSKVLRDGKIIEYSIELEVTAEPKKSRIRMVYKYLDPKPTNDLKFLKLQPDKEQMERGYPSSSTEDFKTTGLKQFAATGRGNFTANRKPDTNDPPGMLMRLIFHVERDHLDYQWQRADDGKNYGVYSIFSFHR